MDNKFQTSFIPKRESTVIQGGGGAVPMSIFGIIAITLFTISFLLSLFVFGYQKYLVGKISAMNSKIVAAKSSYDPELISGMTKLDRRIEAGKQILKNHVASSRIFDFFEKDTLEMVRFKNFAYNTDSKGVVTVTITGEAANFGAVVLQSDVFSKEPFMKNPVFNDLNLNEKGNVTFHFKASLDPAFLLYSNNLKDIEKKDATDEGGAGSSEPSSEVNQSSNL